MKNFNLSNFKRIYKRLNVLRCDGKTLNPSFKDRQYPLEDNPELTQTDHDISGNLMRVNHAGEIAAQGLYVGQALFARNEETYKFLIDAFRRIEHLEACYRRLSELGKKRVNFPRYGLLGP